MAQNKWQKKRYNHHLHLTVLSRVWLIEIVQKNGRKNGHFTIYSCRTLAKKILTPWGPKKSHTQKFKIRASAESIGNGELIWPIVVSLFDPGYKKTFDRLDEIFNVTRKKCIVLKKKIVTDFCLTSQPTLLGISVLSSHRIFPSVLHF